MQDITPVFSVILPTFNGERFLKEALISLFDQSYKNFEIIAVDNGSTDSTLKILNQFRDRINILSEGRRGVTYARNKGIKASKGRYIAFIDQDDIWMANKLEIQKKVLDNNESVGMAISLANTIDERGDVLRSGGNVQIRNEKKTIMQELMIRNVFGPPACMSIKKECFDKVGLYDTSLNGVEDKDLWIRILSEYDVCYTEKPLVLYRVHGQNAHKNVMLMKSSQQKLLVKHFKRINTFNINKAFGYIYLDAGREYYSSARKIAATIELIKAILICPWPIYKYDDKWKLLLKIFLPNKIINVLKHFAGG